MTTHHEVLTRLLRNKFLASLNHSLHPLDDDGRTARIPKLPDAAGIYFMVSNNKVAYIGKTGLLMEELGMTVHQMTFHCPDLHIDAIVCFTDKDGLFDALGGLEQVWETLKMAYNPILNIEGLKTNPLPDLDMGEVELDLDAVTNLETFDPYQDQPTEILVENAAYLQVVGKIISSQYESVRAELLERLQKESREKVEVSTGAKATLVETQRAKATIALEKLPPEFTRLELNSSVCTQARKTGKPLPDGIEFETTKSLRIAAPKV